MENKEITRLLKLTSSLMDLHGENSFKATSYSIASFRLEKIQDKLSEMSITQLEQLEGIGKSMAANIFELNQTGSFLQLEDLLDRTPEEVMKMIEIKGIGPKKIGVLWRELGVQNIDELMMAAKEGRVEELKGFGKKVQDNIIAGIEYLKKNQGFYRIDQVKKPLLVLRDRILEETQDIPVEIGGAVRRSMEVVSEGELLIGTDQISQILSVLDKLSEEGLIHQNKKQSGLFSWRGMLSGPDCRLTIWFTPKSRFGSELVRHTGSTDHLGLVFSEGKTLMEYLADHEFSSETEVYEALGQPFIQPELREGVFETRIVKEGKLDDILSEKDLVGIIHNHSNYSDGQNTLREMAEGCRDMGMQYLGISDHSQTAVYANGLTPERVQEQHKEIDELNHELAPFKIFKGIESDILDDGSLDYEPQVLESFDFIVASVHAQMNMDEKKATERLIKAIENPYTTMMGHLTGRLLLRRDGFPVDHMAIIEACAKHEVIIEINAHPMRLDLDWRWVYHAQDKGVLISINPDAHAVDQYPLMYYGVGIGRKAGLRKEMTFNSWSVEEVDAYFKKRKERIGASI